MDSHQKENYLKALLQLTKQKERVKASELSSLLKVSLPTVNSMVKKLQKEGLVDYERYKPLSLTEKGEKVASLILRKHRLAEMFLVEKMGIGWEEVHEIAEQLEHIDSTVFFERMDDLMGFPKIDPHGSPIPDKNGKITQEPYAQLSSCKTGDRVRLAALANDTSDFLKFLNNRELHLGAEIEIKYVELFDNSMTVRYINHPSETFSQIICDRLLVEYLKP